MKIKKIYVFLFVLTLIGVIKLFQTGLADNAGAQNGSNLKKVILKLHWKHQFQFAGYYAAVEKGLFKKAGLDVVLEEPDEHNDPVKDVIDGRAHFGIGNASLMLDHAQGKPIVAVAPIFQHCPKVLLALKKSASRPSDLIGKKLMVEPQSAEIITFLQSYGVSLSKCILYPHAYSPDPLIKGEVDALTAFLTDEPFLLQKAGVEYHIFSPIDAGVDFYGDTLFTSKNLVEKDPDLVEKFRHASIEGWIYASNNADEMIDVIFNKYSKRHSIEHLKFEADQTKKFIIPEVIQIGYSKPERWSQIAQIYKNQKLLDEDYSLEGFLYEDFTQVKVVYHIWPVILISLIALFITWLASFYYKLNLKLKAEIAQRRQSEENLARSEERYRNLVENTPLPIAITLLETREVRLVNNVFENKLRIKKEFIIGKQGGLFYEKPSSRDEIFDLVKNYGYLKDHIVCFKDCEGSSITFSMSASLIEYEGMPAVFFILNDISEKIKREEEFNKLSSTKDRFLKIIASDLRSSVSTFQSILDYLIKNFNLLKEPEKTDFLYSLKNCADSTYSLLINLLEWTSNATGDLKPAASNMSVYQAVKEALEFFGERASQKQITLESSVEESLKVYCDENMFKTALRNVVSNAVKFTMPGGRIKISAEPLSERGSIKITIADSGIGIKRDRIDKLFNVDTTFSTEGTEGERGSGIGLVLSHEFIKKNNGELIIDSDIGSGARVSIVLPQTKTGGQA
ncbi:MAG: Cell-division control histidine kinase PdhS [bacterium ADurb.Bin243]|nr:MAG: Cell-division control histidine kinase PdhS [bacterium ADurb.Bin243]HOD39653.1 ABC transporter substrate-binding protein [Candidatus Wallbacteria bacterium]